MRSAIAGSLAILLAAAAAQGTGAPAGTQEYTTLEGDTCASIARTFWPGDAEAIDRFHELNPQLGPSPHKLHPGIHMVVNVPGADARLTFLKPAVNEKPRGTPQWKEASAGDDLFRLDEVNTLQGAGAEVTFQDATSLQLDENALIVIYGKQQAKAQLEKSGEVEIVQGEAGLKLSALRGEPLSVKTPAALVALRPALVVLRDGAAKPGESTSLRKALHAGELRIGVDKEKMSRVSVYGGAAEVKAQGAKVTVPDGFGTRVAQGKPPEPPQPLPDAPAWNMPGLRDVRLAQGGAGANLALEWNEVPRGAKYRVQLARDEAFNDRLLDATLEAVRPRKVEARALPPGKYFARVSAVDDKGLISRPSAQRTIDVRGLRADNALPGQPLTGVGELRFAVDPDLEVKVDGKPVPQAFAVREQGKHQIQVSIKGAPGTVDTIGCEILPPRAQLALVLEGGRVQARLTLLDAMSAKAEGLVLRGREGTQVGALTATPQGFVADVTPAQELASVEALYGSAKVAEATLSIPRAPPPAPAPVQQQRFPARGLLGQPSAIIAAGALPGPFIEGATSLEISGQPELGSPSARANGSLGSATVRVATEWGELAGSFSLQHNPALGSASPIGQGSFAFLVQLLEGELAVAAGLDVAFPAGGSADEALDVPRTRLLLAGGLQRGPFSFSTTQALAASNGTRAFGRLAWDSAYVASVRPPGLRNLALVGEVDGVTGEGRALAAFAGSLGARLDVGRIELGASLRTGLFPDGRLLWGQPALFLSARVRLFAGRVQ